MYLTVVRYGSLLFVLNFFCFQAVQASNAQATRDLGFAIFHKDLDCAQDSINRGANVNAVSDVDDIENGLTHVILVALHRFYHTEMVALLLKHGANVEITGRLINGKCCEYSHLWDDSFNFYNRTIQGANKQDPALQWPLLQWNEITCQKDKFCGPKECSSFFRLTKLVGQNDANAWKRSIVYRHSKSKKWMVCECPDIHQENCLCDKELQ